MLKENLKNVQNNIKKAGKGNTKRRAAGYRVGSYKAEKSAKNKKKSL